MTLRTSGLRLATKRSLPRGDDTGSAQNDRPGGRSIKKPPGRERYPTALLVLLIGAITLVGLLLRLRSFGNSVANDEISTYWIVVGHSLGRVMQLIKPPQEVSPPLYFILAWAGKGILGNPAESIRLISLLTGTAAIPLTYFLGVWTIGRRSAALVGATLMAVSPFVVYNSTEARPFMLAMFLALLSTLALLRALDTGRISWWVAYSACSCAAAYAHYTVVFVLAAQFAWAFWNQPRQRLALIVTNVTAALMYLPWLGGFLSDLHGPNSIGLFYPFGISAVGRNVVMWSIGHPSISPGKLPGYLAIGLAVGGLGIGLLGLALRQRGRNWVTRRPSARTVLVVVLALATPVGAAVYSSMARSVYWGPSLIASWPGLALAIGAVVTSGFLLIRLAAVGLVLGGFAIGGAKMLGSEYQRQDYNGEAAFIERVGTSGDPVVIAPSYAQPLSEIDVALADVRRSTPERFQVLRLTVPQLDEMVRAALVSGNAWPPYLHPTAPQKVAEQAAHLAVRRWPGGLGDPAAR